MSTGYVSAEWAKQHHDQWYDDVVAKGKVIEPEESAAKAAAARVSTAS
jgi:cytochrome b subunit of formate dehydrogenase